MIFDTTYATKITVIPLHNTRYKTIHILGMPGIDGHVSVFSIDHNVMQ